MKLHCPVIKVQQEQNKEEKNQVIFWNTLNKIDEDTILWLNLHFTKCKTTLNTPNETSQMQNISIISFLCSLSTACWWLFQHSSLSLVFKRKWLHWDVCKYPVSTLTQESCCWSRGSHCLSLWRERGKVYQCLSVSKSNSQEMLITRQITGHYILVMY